MRILGKLTKLDLVLIQNAFESNAKISVKCGSSKLVGQETVVVHSDGCGEWYMFGGYCMNWALIQANSWGEAYEIYLEEFVTADDMPETEDELEYGTFDGNGNWYSECTTSYVTQLNAADYDQWEVILKEGDSYER